MNQEKFTFLKSLKVLFARLFCGRVHFSKEYAGKVLLMEDGKKFHVIRNLIVDPIKELENSVAVFKVRFKFSGLPLAVNKRLSMIPAPFLMAKPGFRQKIWTVSEDGYFQGIYQGATKEFAETYPQLFMQTRRIPRPVDGDECEQGWCKEGDAILFLSKVFLKMPRLVGGELYSFIKTYFHAFTLRMKNICMP